MQTRRKSVKGSFLQVSVNSIQLFAAMVEFLQPPAQFEPAVETQLGKAKSAREPAEDDSGRRKTPVRMPGVLLMHQTAFRDSRIPERCQKRCLEPAW